MKLKTQIPIFNSIFWWLRQVLGDAAYENYLRSVQRFVGAGHRACPDGAATGGRPYGHIMSREEFFLDSLRRRYSTISRCC